MAPSSRPKVVLFDIGGVCVVSPFRAILDYEISHDIPPGWINHSISASGPQGSWARLERGEIPLDASFFSAFKADLSDPQRWRQYYARHLAKTRRESGAAGAEEAAFQAPGVPDLDAEWLYWEMMRISRAPDQNMFPALKRLRQHADASKGGLIVAALSNTSIFPSGHEFNDPSTPAGQFNAELKGQFDLFVSSAHVGMRKPDQVIYEYTIKELDQLARKRGDKRGIRAEDIVFLDDIGANLKAARSAGMRTIRVVLGHTERAVAELEEVMGLELQSRDRAKL